jgi:hypothetical protein
MTHLSASRGSLRRGAEVSGSPVVACLYCARRRSSYYRDPERVRVFDWHDRLRRRRANSILVFGRKAWLMCTNSIGWHYQPKWGAAKFVNPGFAAINARAYFDCQQHRVLVCTSKTLRKPAPARLAPQPETPSKLTGRNHSGCIKFISACSLPPAKARASRIAHRSHRSNFCRSAR